MKNSKNTKFESHLKAIYSHCVLFRIQYQLETKISWEYQQCLSNDAEAESHGKESSKPESNIGLILLNSFFAFLSRRKKVETIVASEG